MLVREVEIICKRLRRRREWDGFARIKEHRAGQAEFQTSIAEPITAVTTTPPLLPSVGAAFQLLAVVAVVGALVRLVLVTEAVDVVCGNGVAATAQLLLLPAK